MATQGYAAQPAPGTESATPTQAGAVPEKKGIAEKVKGLLGGHGHKTDATATAAGAGAHPQPVYGDATPTAGNAESTRVGCLDKIKSKAGVGHGHGEGVHTDPNASPDFNGGTNVNSSAAVHGGWPHPTNPNQGGGAHAEPHHSPGVAHSNQVAGSGYDQAASDHGDSQPHPQNPTGVTNAEGGAVLHDHHGNVHEGPRDDTVKKEGFVSKILDKLHSPKGKPAHTATPASY